MISFSQKIKTELLEKEATVYCCSAAELASYLLILGRDDGDYISIASENEGLIDRIIKLSGKVLKINIKPLKLGGTYSLMISKGQKFRERYDFLFDKKKEEPELLKIYKKDCCRSSFIKGIFVSCGLIVDPEKNYNLEFFFKTKELSDIVREMFLSLELELKETKRKNMYILYTKNSNIICDFLTRIGAHNEQMQVLNLKIEREYRNDYNRIINSEIANMDKTIKASIKHIRAIEKIKKQKGLEYLPQELYEVAVLRLENRDLSIGALAEKLNSPITKSGLNHRLNKILKIAEEI